MSSYAPVWGFHPEKTPPRSSVSAKSSEMIVAAFV
jgi:hypothetical protein